MLTPTEYYRDPEVRERIAEYCGGTAREPELCTAEYIVGYGEALLGIPAPEPYISTPLAGFNAILEKGLDFFRSIWDKVHLLGLLDIEYLNLDYPGEVYFDQVTTFKKIEPVYQSILSIYREYGIQPLTIMTGQGYHFSFQIQSGTKTALMLEDVGLLNQSLIKKYPGTLSQRHRPVSLRYGQAYDGMGRVMECFAHRIIKETVGRTDLPLLITDVSIGIGQHGREGISLDLSCFGDPVYMRDCRCAFSTHQKHKVQRWKVGDAIADGTPIQIAIPRKDLSLPETLALRRHFHNAAEYAAGVECFIPDSTVSFKNLIEDYQGSGLYKFHQWFDSEKQHPPEKWGETYDRMNYLDVPPCVRRPLEQPNDLLLKPTNLQTLTRCLLARGWHPRHIAGLVTSRWVNGPGWPPDQWKHFDAASRANFYVRIFSGLLAVGLDEMVDHNCVSHQEKGNCPQPFCGYNLADYRWDGKF
ncbi:MAG: hypothetical protein RAO92_09150 [Candidatus Euphemobacter frigidus]|nr:hypothetical protein [Candidatus Euphemobacter frigidus]MDP8276553.1 hypothetical protein [Candidatus Euphemobacter frigidus]